jgi:nucleoside permease NupC
MERFTGIIGIVLILSLAFLASNNRKKINLRLVLSGLGLQMLIAILILKVPAVQTFFEKLGFAKKVPILFMEVLQALNLMAVWAIIIHQTLLCLLLM